jgi:hypothetical protein
VFSLRFLPPYCPVLATIADVSALLSAQRQRHASASSQAVGRPGGIYRYNKSLTVSAIQRVPLSPRSAVRALTNGRCREHNETRPPNARSDLASELRRRRLVALADKNQGRTGNRSKTGARVRAAQDRLLLAQVSLEACVYRKPKPGRNGEGVRPGSRESHSADALNSTTERLCVPKTQTRTY